MLTFLDLNGYSLTADQDKLADKIVELADGKTTYKLFALWLKPKLIKA